VQRRFGKDIANYVIDPLIRGICAGDSKRISVKFLMKTLFEFEQKYGSVTLGFLLSRMFKKKGPTAEEETVGFSNIALSSLTNNWAVWTLEGGLETLPWTMEQYLSSQGGNTQFIKNCGVKAIRLGCRDRPAGHIEVEYVKDGDPVDKKVETLICNHVISTIPGIEIGKIMKGSKPFHPSLSKVFETMESVDVQVTNLMYKNPNILNQQAFGFLVPSSEKSVNGLLGVVFDTCSFPQGDRTVLTVMSDPNVSGEHSVDDILSFIKTTLKIDTVPDDVNTEVLKDCIPQYTVGHYEKVDAVRRYVRAAKLPLTLAGASYDGVSVNDCIYSGKKAAESIEI
jgi:oxygen-dependent protoporphyrinogen oxidase